jgi:hypothetical protein
MRLAAVAGQIAVACLLLAIVAWGRSVSHFPSLVGASETLHWSPNQQLLDRAWAGAVPGIAADVAVLNIFNIYARARSQHGSNAPWRDQLYFELRSAQAMDPYFRDVYRLTEGLLAYEAQRWKEAVDILASSGPWLNSADPLLAASFIAHQYMHDDKLAIRLAYQAIKKPNASQLTIGFATALIRKRSGCKMALLFLETRLRTLPEQYRQGILLRMQRLRQSKACIEEERRQVPPLPE